MSEPDFSLKLAHVLQAAIEGHMEGVRVALPARIESYDRDRRRANIQLLIPDEIVTEDAERTTEAVTHLTDVPVLFPGSGTVRIRFPIRAGDPCWAMFSSSCISRVKATGSTDVVDPENNRHHHESDAVVMPIPTIGDAAADDDAMIEFTDDGLINAGGTEPVVKRSEFLGHTHLTAGTGAPSPPTSGTPGSSATFPGTAKLRA